MKLTTLNLISLLSFMVLIGGMILNWQVMIRNDGKMPVLTNYNLEKDITDCFEHNHVL